MTRKETSKVQLRRKARSIALKALYEIDCAYHPAEGVITQRLEDEPLNEQGTAFVQKMVYGVLKHRVMLDEMIHEHAPEWPVNQMAIIDRNILRMAIFELVVSRQVPLKVAINEAVELAKAYGSDSAPRFVNGVLGTLAARPDITIPSDGQPVDDQSSSADS